MLVLMVAVVASCGGGSSDRAAERLSRLDDQASVAAATGALTRAGLNGGDFFELTLHKIATRGLVLWWQSVVLTAGCILLVIIIASLLSIRRVVVLEPAEVFRG